MALVEYLPGRKELDSAVGALFGPAGKELGELVADRVRLWRWRSALRIMQQANRIKEMEGLTDPPSLKFFLPFVEEASKESEESELCDWWARLLATSHPDNDAFDRIWVGILKDISPEEARFLTYLLDNQSLCVVPNRLLNHNELPSDIFDTDGLSQDTEQVYKLLENKYGVRVTTIFIDEWRSLLERHNFNVPTQFEKALRRRVDTSYGKQNAKTMISLSKLGLIQLSEAEVSRWSSGEALLAQSVFTLGADYIQLTTLGRELVVRCTKSGSIPTVP